MIEPPPQATPRSREAAPWISAAVMLAAVGGICAAFDGDARRIAANIAVLVLAMGAGFGCVRAARRTVGRTRRGWAALALACWAWGAGQVAWTVYEEVLGIATPYPSLADVGYLAFPTAALVGLVCLTPPGSGLATRRRLLDALIVGCAIGLLAWVAALETILGSTGGTLLAAAVSVAYPLADIVVLTVAVLTATQTRDDPGRWGLLSAAVLAMAASDTAFAYQVAAGTYATGTVVEWGWRAAFCLLGVAGLRVRRAPPAPGPLLAPAEVSRTGLLLPYLPLITAVIAVTVKSAIGHGLGLVSVVLVVELVLLVLLRQYLTVRENQLLTTTVQQREVQLHHLAFHDDLTGLANRALFLDRLGHALELSDRAPQAVSVAFIDLDGFKAVNDTLGHAAGDVLLVQVAQRLTGALRASDTLARLGGDEFAVLVEQGGDPATVAHRLLDALREPFHVDGRTVGMSASIGVATHEPEVGGTAGSAAARAGELLHRADVAMYAVKSAGKADVGTHSGAVGSGAVRSGAVRSGAAESGAVESGALRSGAVRSGTVEPPSRHDVERRHLPSLHRAFATALERGEVQAFYQPVVDPVTGRIAALEALARWTHDGIDIPPGTFVPICESAGLSSQLTALMLEQACAQLAGWNRGMGHRRLRVAVNVNPLEFSDVGMPDRIAAVIDRHGLAPEQLALEMTEIAMNNRPDTAIDVMHQLRAIGVRLALDDFGTGYSTLARLARTPVTTVKIDRFFVAHIDHDEQQRRFLRGLLDLTHHLGLRSVAEGVERPGQLDELRRQGCDLVQGHLVGRPVSSVHLTPVVLGDVPMIPPHLLGAAPVQPPARLRTARWVQSGYAP